MFATEKYRCGNNVHAFLSSSERTGRVYVLLL